jgi:MSHA biogenesis protein MshQ
MYTFSTVSDDGVRLWVGNQLLIDNWTDHAATTNTSVSVSLQSGQRYAVRMEYYENLGGAFIQLMWAYPGQGTQIIPQSAFSASTAPPAAPGLQADYYNGMSFGALVSTRTDASVDFWWSGSPAANVPADNFSVRWTGEIVAPVTGTYTFSTVSDDGVRLWIGNQLLIDNWTDHAATTNTSVAVSLQSGQHYALQLEYYENLGGAFIQLRWAYPGQGTQVIPQSALLTP